MKKILSFTLALLMVLGVCTFTAYAEVDADVQAVADAITAEMLTQDNEPAYLVTKNLDMSIEGDLSLPEGVSVTFSSNDAQVIANDGTVTRTSTYDGEATITATVSKEGSDSVAKELKYTVLKTETTVLYSDNLYYPEMKDKEILSYDSEAGKIASNLDKWSYSCGTESKLNENVVSTLASKDDGYAIDYKRINTTTGAQFDLCRSDKLNVEANNASIHMTLNVPDWGNGTKRADFVLYGLTKDGNKKVLEVRFSDTYTAPYKYDASTQTFVSAGSSSSLYLKKGNDRKVEIKIDYASNTYTLFINGSQVLQSYEIPDLEFINEISYFTFGMVRHNTSPAEMLIKDIAVTTSEVSAIRYEEITNQAPNAITQNLKLPEAFNGKEVTWVSSNPQVIATDGTVTRDSAEHDVTLTAKIEGEEDKVFNFCVLSDRVSTKYWLSSENFEATDAYKTIWGTGNNGGNATAIDGVKDANLTFTQMVIDKGEDGGASRVLYLHRANEDQTKTCYGLGTLYKTASVNGRNMYSNGLITIKSQLCFDFKEGETPRYSVTFYERGNNGDMGDKVVFNYATGKVGIGDYSYTGKLPARGEWFDLEIMIDTKREMTEVFIDGVSVVGHEMELANTCEHDYYGSLIATSKVPGISGIFFNCNTANTGMYMDNLALYTINDEEYYSDVNEYNMYTEKEPVTDYDFSLAIVGDIQKTTYHWPEKVPTIYNWIAANAEEKNIVRAISLGDITEKDTEAEYNIVKDAFKVLDGVVPHTIMRGNHDVANFDKYITYDEYKDSADGVYNSSMKNTYSLFEQGGRKYMLLNLDCGAKADMIAWANEVVAAHPDYNVIVATHLYMYRDGRLISSWYGMEDYGQSSGANIWNDFVSQHENIVMVICGHVSTDKVVMNERVGVNGNVVKELLIDPQATDMFYEGAGIVTMLYFSEDGKTVQVENYSTTQEAFYRKDCQFEFELQVVDGDTDAPVTPEEPTYSELAIGEIKMTFDVYLEETVEGSTVVVGLFDSNNKLIDIREYPAEPNITAQFTYNPETKYARAFCVKDGTAYPVCMKVEKIVK